MTPDPFQGKEGKGSATVPAAVHCLKNNYLYHNRIIGENTHVISHVISLYFAIKIDIIEQS